ncbi:MAG: response regulator [Deltaproteobacteria bacterium]|nr:response regulator [Deltaproteobacteria bacterium]
MNNKASVLLVDDEVRLLDSTAKLLGEEFHILKAVNGRLAWNYLMEMKADCVVLDIVMPGMTGIDLLEKKKLHKDNTPVIVVTGESRLKYAESCADLGVSGYIRKPYDVEVLACRIRDILSRGAGKKRPYPEPKTLMHLKVQSALTYVQYNYQEPITLKLAARELDVSEDHLNRLFKKEIGKTFNQHLIRFRLEKAKELLSETPFPLKEIAETAGFGRIQGFYQQFKKSMNMTPGEYRLKCSKWRVRENYKR